MHPPCPWQHRYRRQPVRFVSSSTPFLAWYGLEALATVRVEEDTGAVPCSVDRLRRLWAQRAQFRQRAVGENRPLSHSGRFRGHKGAGKTGCAPHPRSRVQCASKNAHTSIQVWRRHPAFPAQWLYGLYDFVLVTGFLATIASFSFRFRQLDASTGASDPNDFTVRVCHARQSQPSRPPLPAPRLRRWPTPLWWDRMAGVLNLICPTRTAEYFCAKG